MAGQSTTISVAQEGRALVEQLGGRWSGHGGMCRCPCHDDRSPSLSVRPGRSRLLFHCFAGCDTADILRALKARGSIGHSSGGAGELAQGRSPSRNLSPAAIRLWGTGRAIASSPAETYLAGRRLVAGSPELRFHPRTPHGPKPFTRLRPALIAAVRDGNGLVAVHRTFLERGGPGRAWHRDARCALGPLGQGAVRLGGSATRIGLAEGIETALSASTLFGIPCWATLGIERFRRVALPDEVEELVLFLDNDRGGRRAEALAREAFGDLSNIEARYPPRPGEDWNDVLRASADAGGGL